MPLMSVKYALTDMLSAIAKPLYNMTDNEISQNMFTANNGGIMILQNSIMM